MTEIIILITKSCADDAAANTFVNQAKNFINAQPALNNPSVIVTIEKRVPIPKV
jgi:hypothetical protein